MKPVWTPTAATARLISVAAEQWRQGLVDVSGSNRRLFYRPLKVATLDLAEAAPAAVRRLLSGERVTISTLFPDDGTPEALAVQGHARRAADAIWRKAMETQEETGANPARLAVGAVTFTPADAGVASGAAGPKAIRYPKAPLILLPVRFTPAPGTRSVASLEVDGEPELNSALRYVLRVQHGVELDEDRLFGDADPDGPGGLIVDPALVPGAVGAALSGEVRGWQVLPHLAVDYFGSDRELMLRDLSDEAVLAAHPIVAAMAGDAAAQAYVAGEPLPPADRDPDLAAPDSQSPAEEFLVLDADASQHRVVDLALAGRNLVVQGPPGTGKSQTIANLIASFAAQGRTVLFVAQKRAAIEAVTERLEKRGLGHLLLQVFDASVRRSHVLEQIGASLQGMVSAPPVDAARLHRTLTGARAHLVQHREALHRRRPELGDASLGELYQRMYQVRPDAQTQDRLPFRAVSAWGLDGVERYAADLEELARLGALDPQWRDAEGWDPDKVVDEQLSVAAYDAAVTASSVVVALRRTAARAAVQAGLAEPKSPADVPAFVEVLRRAAELCATVDPQVLDARQVDDDELIRLAHSVADRRLRRRDRAEGVQLGWGARRAHRRRACALTQTQDRRRASTLLREAIALRHEFGGRPIAPAADAADVARHSEELAHELTQLAPLVRGLDLQVLDWHDLATCLHVLVTDQRRAVMPRAHALTSSLDAAGAAPAMTAVSARIQAGHEPSLEEIGDRLRWMALNTLLDHVTTTDRAISGSGVPGALDTAATTFRATDASAIQLNADRVRRAAGEAALSRLSEHREEQRFLQAELKKRRKLRSLRELVEQSPEAVLAAAPCWAMSPLLVSRYLPTTTLFDVVVYDEASQVTLPDAVPSILRGRQVIVAGDDRQLPPTTVFTKLLDGGGATDGAPLPTTSAAGDDPIADDEHIDESAELEEGPAATTEPTVAAPALGNDYASVLTALSAILPTRTLLWHYRSRDERLIAVSNSHVYGNRLVTFPGPQSDEALQHVVVPPSKGVGKHNKSPESEVTAVVELCVDHAERQRGLPPERWQSLGVIAAGIEHARRIEKALFDRVVDEADPHLSRFFDIDGAEPVFVKNIERVQGDERDHIVFSVGYGPSDDGRLRYVWGPLLGEYGVNRLNVAISRARSRMTLVTSFTPDQLPADGSSRAGYQLLREFVLFAAASGDRDVDQLRADPEMNPFELDVYERLLEAGLRVDTQYGVAGYRLDFAVRHPQQPGRHVLAVETDGATYHSGWTARERDRLRQQHLESLGWRFHRIWSTDYWRDPEAEIADVVSSGQTAVDRLADGLQPADEPPIAESARPTRSTSSSGASRGRPAPPWVSPGRAISTYTDQQLLELVRWLRSDGNLRLHDDEIGQLMQALGLTRRSANIVARLEQTLQRAQRT